MKEYTAKQIKQLEKNPYVFKVTKHMIYYTAKFKEDFWVSYQAGNTPRKILEDFGFDLSIFRQKQIDSLVQHIKKQALAGEGFSEGANRKRRIPPKPTDIEELAANGMYVISVSSIFLAPYFSNSRFTRFSATLFVFIAFAILL